MLTEETATQPMPEEDSAQAEPKVDGKTKKRWAEFRNRAEICKTYRKKLIRNWTTNIDFRRGKPFASQSDEEAISVNLDWSYTKTKQAELFSQVPQIRIAHNPESVTAGPWLAKYERHVNDTLVKAGIESAMDEVLPDCINAAGFGVVMVSRDAITRDKQIPEIDMSIFPPQIQAEAMKTGKLFGQDIPMQTVPETVASRYNIERISPADFLWPVDFTGSDFNKAPWLGRSGRLTWEEAKSRFQLKEEDKQDVLTEEKTVEDRLSHDYDREHLADDGKVGYDEMFYNSYQFDPEATAYEAIHHLVFLHGRPEPVIDRPWEGQIVNPQDGKLVGALIKPIQVLTLTYITDEDIPPSDSAIGRTQVIELNKGRNHISKQRARNAPWTWFDVNRLDPAIQNALMRGTWQHAIPVQGDGSRVLGSVQQPAMHEENFIFDRIAKQDAQESWTIGPNQVGGGEGIETKGEAGFVENNFRRKIGRERAKVAAFFVNIARVLGGLMCLYEDPAVFGEGFDPGFSEHLAYSILADSTVLVDSTQRLEQLNGFVNTYAKTGYVNIEPVLKEIATLVGLDPNLVIAAPKPQSPEPPNISLRLTGGDDMMNPLLLAFMIKAGQAPEPELIQKAKDLIQSAVQMPQPPQPGQPPPGPLPPGPPTNIGEANPQAGLLPTIGKRAEDGPQGSPATGGGQQ